jgi:hypothetical protein
MPLPIASCEPPWPPGGLLSSTSSRAHVVLRSLTPPAYYAQLCSKRGRLYLNDVMFSRDWDTATGEDLDGERRRVDVSDATKLAWGNGVHKDIKESMFYI